MATHDWVGTDATTSGSNKTLRLIAALGAQMRRLKGAHDESRKKLVDFWTGKIEVDAVSLNDGDKSVRVYVGDFSIELAQGICQNFRTRAGGRMSACCVKGSRVVCIVLGLETPPENLDIWVISHVEKMDLATTV